MPKGKKAKKVPKKLTKADLSRQRFEARMMQDALEDAEKGIQAYADRVGRSLRTILRVKQNADGSVDGELRTLDIPRGIEPGRIFIAAEENMSVPRSQWISHGFLFGERPSEEHLHYKRRKPGLAIVSTYYTRTRPALVADSFVTVRGIINDAKARGRKKPTEIITRLHWNPNDEKPRRRY